MTLWWDSQGYPEMQLRLWDDTDETQLSALILAHVESMEMEHRVKNHKEKGKTASVELETYPEASTVYFSIRVALGLLSTDLAPQNRR